MSTCKSVFRNLIKPLYIHPWVTAWAFDNILISPFHHDYLLPIHMFQNPIIIRGESRYYDPYVSTILNNQCEGHNALIPVYSKNNITVGYSLAFPSDFEKLANKSNRAPFTPPFIARFILDHSTNDFIMIIPSEQYQIFSIAVFGITNHSQHTFIVPAKEYTWDDLPDDPIVGLHAFATSPYMKNIDGRICNFEMPNSSELRQINEIDVTPEDVQGLMSKLSISPNQQITSVKNISNTTSMTTSSRNCLYIEYESYQRIGLALSNFQLTKQEEITFEYSILKILNNYSVFVGERIDTNVIQVPDYDFMTKVRSFHHYFESCNMTIRRAMGSKCAHVYYSATLSFSNDRLLLENQLKEILDEEEKIQEKVKRKETKKNILEERRKRNRLSAARSYEQKKQAFKKMEEELETSKVVIKKLKEKHRIESERNRQLKGMIKLSKICR